MNAITPIEAAAQHTLSALVWEGDKAPLAKAFVAAQSAMDGVKKAATNTHFKTNYADLAQVVEGVTPSLNANGVGVLQFPSYDGDLIGVTTTLIHESGSSVTATLHLRPTKNDPQSCGSAITYARRYALLAITGCAPEDDDGNAASQRPTQRHAEPRQEGPSSIFIACKAAIDLCEDEPALNDWKVKNAKAFEQMGDADYAAVGAYWRDRLKACRAKPAAADDFGLNGDDVPSFTK